MRAIRHLLKWTQQDLADAIGLGNKSQVSRIERGVRTLHRSELLLLQRHVQAASLSPKKRRLAFALFENGDGKSSAQKLTHGHS